VPKISAGLVIYRKNNNRTEVLLVHPGGPFWVRKDKGAWSIPKGRNGHEEDLLATARREVKEETGLDFNDDSSFVSLGSVTQKSGKIVHAWAVKAADFLQNGPNQVPIQSNTVKMGLLEFPEVDRAEFFTLEEAKDKINPAQIGFLDRLTELIVAYL